MIGPSDGHGRWTAVALAIALGIGLSACGPDKNGTEVADRRASVGVEMGEPAGDVLDAFNRLPRVPESQPLTPREERGGSVVRSYEATGRTAEQILRYYEDELGPDEWEMTSPPRSVGEDTWRGEWVGHGATLVVSASDQPAENGARPTQYSLTLTALLESPTP